MHLMANADEVTPQVEARRRWSMYPALRPSAADHADHRSNGVASTRRKNSSISSIEEQHCTKMLASMLSPRSSGARSEGATARRIGASSGPLHPRMVGARRLPKVLVADDDLVALDPAAARRHDHEVIMVAEQISEPIERSIRPVIMTKLTPRVTIAMKEKFLATFCTLPCLKKWGWQNASRTSAP